MVLTHRTWEVVFASSPAALDRVVPINGVGTRIVGVMPPGFGFPVAQDIWLPLPATDAGTASSVDGVSLFARLAPGVTPAQAAAEASTVLQRIAASVGHRRRARSCTRCRSSRSRRRRSARSGRSSSPR